MEKFEISCIQRGNKGFRFSLFSILSSSDLIYSCFSLAVLLNKLTLKGIGHAILGISLSIDQMVIELTEITK